MVRVLVTAAATFAILYVILGLAIFATGCTEPGTCSFPGEVARDHGAKILFGGTILAAVAAAATRHRAHGVGTNV